MTIQLPNILPALEPQKYKVHLACWNGDDQPLDVFIRDKKEWDGWNTWRNKRDEFNRKYIFSLIDFYPEKNVWLFGGIYEVIKRNPEIHAHSYEVKLSEELSEFIGRLKIKLKRPGRARAVKLENYYNEMVVKELLPRRYSGEAFCGYENIDHDFTVLETIIRSGRTDWKAALEHVKGVYVISDKKNGKVYVGSAYGEYGIWSRWSNYIHTGHGWNDELTRVIKKEGISYARKYFKITLLEYRPARTDDKVIIDRENYWKGVFMSRGQYGYNKN